MIYSISGAFGFHLSSRPEMYRTHDGLGALYPARSRVFICPFCRKSWAEIKIDGKKVGEEAYTVMTAPCERCPASFRLIRQSLDTTLFLVPGSLLDSDVLFDIDWGLLETLPEPLLRRELLLHIKAYDERTNSERSVERT